MNKNLKNKKQSCRLQIIFSSTPAHWSCQWKKAWWWWWWWWINIVERVLDGVTVSQLFKSSGPEFYLIESRIFRFELCPSLLYHSSYPNCFSNWVAPICSNLRGERFECSLTNVNDLDLSIFLLMTAKILRIPLHLRLGLRCIRIGWVPWRIINHVSVLRVWDNICSYNNWSNFTQTITDVMGDQWVVSPWEIVIS